MARTKRCQDLDHNEGQDTLMPVSPSDQIVKNDLSHNGETANDERRGIDEAEEVEGCSGKEDEDNEMEGDGEEVRVSVGKMSPKDPTKKQREEHERTHLPYRSWCEDCVRARARNAPHHKQKAEDPLEEIKVPRIHMDYFFMSREDEKASSNPILVIVDEKSGSRYARLVGKKGLSGDGEMDWLVEDIVTTLKGWGHAGGAAGHLILKSDGEAAILAVKNAVMQRLGGTCIPEQPAKGEKAENGRIEEAGKTIRQLFCTFLYRMERGVDDKIPLEADIISWIMRWAAICYSRFQVGQDGKTAWERLRRRSCNVPVVPIGETVWYKELGEGGDRTNKAETEWFKGVWLGPSLRSTETLVGTSKGVVRAYTTERLSPSTQWDINQILDMRGTPQRPDPSKPGLSIPVKIRLEPDVKIDMPASRPARKEEGPIYIYIYIFQ